MEFGISGDEGFPSPIQLCASECFQLNRWRFVIHLSIDKFSSFVPCVSLTYNSSYTNHSETQGPFQRVIENFWRRMKENFTGVFCSTFRMMEQSGILNHESDVDIMCLHYVSTPLILDALFQSQSTWNLDILPAEVHHNAIQLFQGHVVNVPEYQCPIPHPILSQFRNAANLADVTIDNLPYYFSFLKGLVTG